MTWFIKCLKLRKPAWPNLIPDDASSPNLWDGSECFRLGRNSVPLFAELLSIQPYLIGFEEWMIIKVILNSWEWWHKDEFFTKSRTLWTTLLILLIEWLHNLHMLQFRMAEYSPEFKVPSIKQIIVWDKRLPGPACRRRISAVFPALKWCCFKEMLIILGWMFQYPQRDPTHPTVI